MAKAKRSFVVSEDEELISPSLRQTSKLPIDNTGANRGLYQFQEIPVGMLHPFSQKGAFDFSRHGKTLSEKFVETVNEFGIIEVLIVRKSPTQRDFFEIISGESRWTHAKAAGLAAVPCRVMDLNDNKAHRLFVILNLMRREMTPRDKINAWYDYFMERKEQSVSNAELAKELKEDTETAAAIGGKGITVRSIQMYVKMHNLTESWLDRLDNGEASMRIGYRVAFFSEDIQDELLNYKVAEKGLANLYERYFGKEKKEQWTDDVLSKTFPLLNPPSDGGEDVNTVKPPKPKLNKAERAFTKAFKAATPHMVETLRTSIHPDDYEKFEEIIQEGIKLYYAQKGSN